MGIRDHPTAPRSPWQNGHAERLIGSIRRECLDHAVVLGEAHLRRMLRAYAGYYNDFRTHLSLVKDSPDHRPIQRFGRLTNQPILGGTSSSLLSDIVSGRHKTGSPRQTLGKTRLTRSGTGRGVALTDSIP